MLAPLDEVLAYRNPEVIERFRRDMPAFAHQAEELFVDLLKFLWLSRRHELDQSARPDDDSLGFVLVMHEEMRAIDEMWHAFIVFTRPYMEFCERYFGGYMHHEPNVGALLALPTGGPFEEDMGRFLSYAYDQLGEATIHRWFASSLEPDSDEAFPIARGSR